jgi:Rrf2 family nitric oxide-sensitive transcriptional repressor
MRLTRATSHAIRILIDCAAAQGALLKVGDIAERLDITPLNAFKIVNLLSRTGFLEAIRGRNGGVRLAKPAEDIRIGEIVRTIEATEVEIAGATGASRGRRQMNAILDDALEAFIGVLNQHSLAELAAGRSKIGTAVPASGKRRRRNGTAKARGSNLLRS